MANKKIDNGKLYSDQEKWLAERKIGAVLWTFLTLRTLDEKMRGPIFIASILKE